MMLDHAVLKSVAAQLMGSTTSADNPHVSQNRRDMGHPRTSEIPQLRQKRSEGVDENSFAMEHPGEIEVEGQRLRITRTGSRRFRTVRFRMGGKEYQAIEQNPEKPSRWGKLARDGHRVVQFRELLSGKYVAVVVDDKVMEYQGR
jgi:hypothetical protein